MATAAAAAAATGGTNHIAREARRRRIIERGSDRLALISGRIQSLPPEPDQSLPSASPPPAQIPATDIADSSQHEEDAAANSSPPNGESVQEQAQEATHNSTLPDQEPVKEHEQHAVPDTSRSVPSRPVASHDDTNGESSQTPPPQQRPALEQTRHLSLFKPSKIKSAVAASENARICCSVAAALLAIVSYLKLPVVGVRGIMLLRPFYLLLLTNTTIVLGRVILGRRGAESRARGRSSSAPAAGGNDLADQLGRALEIGMLMQKIVGAVSMDFSIYAVVLVCGLHLAQMLV